MPGDKGFTSKAQRGFMYAHHPDIAKRMSSETPEKLAEGGEVEDEACPHCGRPYEDDNLPPVSGGHPGSR